MNQTEAILNYLKEGNSLTPLEALRHFNCLRLSGRCYDLRKQGHPIYTIIVKGENGKHYASYRYGEQKEMF